MIFFQRQSVFITSCFLIFLLASPAAFSANKEGKTFVSIASPGVKPQSAPDQGKTQEHEILIRLEKKQFDPLKSSPGTDSKIAVLKAYKSGETGYYIVQFDGPIQIQWKKALEEQGAEILNYIPDFAFIVRMPADNEQAVRGLAHCRWLGIYQPAYRISQRAVDKISTSSLEADGDAAFVALIIIVFPGEDVDSISLSIKDLGGIVDDLVTTKWKSTIRIRIRADRISDLPGITGIKWIEPVHEWELNNSKSTDIMNVRTVRETYNLFGEGQIVAVCDSGLDNGVTDPSNLHDDFEDGNGLTRVKNIFDLVGDGAADTISGHGTHVAGSVLGNGIMSGSDPLTDSYPDTSEAGIAPMAELIFQASADNSTGALTGIPPDLNTLFEQADVAGASIHTNSWGANLNGEYTSNSENVDEYVWDHPDFLILFSAGNHGADLDGDGVVDLYNTGVPASAKNCITVGASEGDRPPGFGNGFDYDWGFAWPRDYSVFPIFSDHISDSPNGMAAFSSRGPCMDGRIKPDIVAPGTNILSTRSAAASGNLWGEHDDYYLWSGGTSMSTPLVAGAAVLMREYLTGEKGIANPSAALIKAALVNSAEDISPGQYGVGVYREIPDSVPNNIEGWGRLNFGNTVFPAPPQDILYYDERNTLNTGEMKSYSVRVSESGYPLNINLVWMDYPGSPAAEGGLVNDLDLQLIDPDNLIHYPDNASQKSATTEISYVDGAFEVTWGSVDKVAVRFEPATYPVNIETCTFLMLNPNNTASDVDIVVYDDDGNNGLPGTELFRKTLVYVPTGYLTVGLNGVVISEGEFYIAIEKTNDSLRIVQDDTDTTDRSYYYDAGNWLVDSGYMTHIWVRTRTADFATDFDRVNNSVGMRIESAETGVYTIQVSGYNVPQGPQPYALVVNGAVQEIFPGQVEFETIAYTTNEGGGVFSVNVLRTGGSDGDISVDYTILDGSAHAGNDYTAGGGTLNWGDGDTASKQIFVTIINDNNTEPDETITLELKNATGGAVLGEKDTTVLTIGANDDRTVNPAIVGFEKGTYTVNEDSGVVTVLVMCTGGSGDIWVDYTISEGTANSGNDFQATGGALVWPLGDTTPKAIVVEIIDDDENEEDEDFQVTLDNLNGSAIFGANKTTRLIIQSNDSKGSGSNNNSSGGGGGGGCFIDIADSRPGIR